MTAEKEIRKLAAIMHADVKGYSRLMGDDESDTVRCLGECRRLIDEIVQEHGGRVVNAPGDSILAEFPSVVSAVRCAVEIQGRLKERNADLPDNRKMAYRIGVNLGDVIECDGAIYGDGVNIAARIESLAYPGGVSISRTVFDHAHKKLNYGYEYQGEHNVKNISDPVQVYKLLTAPESAGKMIIGPKPHRITFGGFYLLLISALFLLATIALILYNPTAIQLEPASIEKMSYPPPEKSSIAVLPFDNMSDDPEQEYFSDGITEEIITALSKVHKLFVIARNSTFTYKGKPVSIPTVGKELGVRYVLEGSVRKSGDRVRITAQLIDAQTNRHLWAERYDRDLKDIFAIQDEITKMIIAALQVRLTEGEQARVYERGTKNLEAYLKVLQAAEIGRRQTKEENIKARQLAEEAISLDPNYACAYRELGATYMREVWLRISKSPSESLKQAAGYAKKALDLDETLPPAHTLLGQVLVLAKDFDKAIAEGQRVVELDPNGAESHWYLGMALVFAGRAEEAIPCLEKAIRLDPYVPSHYSHILALAHWYLNQYEEAIKWGQKSVERSPDNQLSNAVLILCYGSAGRDEDARAQAVNLLEINPKYCVRTKGGDRFKDPEANKRFRETMLKAGVPICPTIE